MDSLSPVMLIVDLRDDDLRRAGQSGYGGGAGAAVVHDGGNAREEDLLVHLADGEAVGLVVHKRDTSARRPSARAVRTITSLRSGDARMLPKPK